MNGSACGVKVHHLKENWDGIIVAVKGARTVTVQSDGGYKGDYDLHEFGLFVVEPRDQIKVIVTRLEFLEELKTRAFAFLPVAIEFLRKNQHQHDVPVRTKIDQRVLDAALVGFINFVGVQLSVDYALNTTDLPHLNLLEKIARAADVEEPPKPKKRGRMPKLTKKVRDEALARGARETAALSRGNQPRGFGRR